MTAFVGEMSGIVSVSRSAVQDLCASVFSIPLSKGAIQKMVNRVSEALVPHYEAIGRVARAAPVGHLDETSWFTQGRAALAVGDDESVRRVFPNPFHPISGRL